MNDTEAVSGDLASMLSTCTMRRLWAEQDEGPYRRDTPPTRRNVVEDRHGVALQLGIRLGRDRDLGPLDATVEIWQCDALGRYSGFPPPDPSVVVTAATAPRAEYLAEQTFLRGRQRTDAAAMVGSAPSIPAGIPAARSTSTSGCTPTMPS